MGSSPGAGHVGIGIKFTEDNGEHIVTSLLPDGPADATKQVFQGDKMVAVDGVPLYGKSSSEVIDLILGPPGVDLTLTLQSSEYNGEDVLSPGSLLPAQSPTSNGREGTPDLRSLDSPPSKEFELVSPGKMRESGALPGASPAARDCSVGIKFAMDHKMRITVQQVVPGSVRTPRGSHASGGSFGACAACTHAL